MAYQTETVPLLNGNEFNNFNGVLRVFYIPYTQTQGGES